MTIEQVDINEKNCSVNEDNPIIHINDRANSQRDSDECLFITETAQDAQFISEHNASCIAISELKNGKLELHPKAIRQLSSFNLHERIVYIIPNNADDLQEKNMYNAVKGLGAFLVKNNATPMIIKLPDGMSLHEYVSKHSAEDFIKLRDSAFNAYDFYHDILMESGEILEPEEYLSDTGTFYFQIPLAEELGLNEAIVLQKIHNWIKYNRKTKNKRMIKDGRVWTFRSYSKLNDELPFFSEATIMRAIHKLEENGVLISQNYNKHKYDRTKWYTIDYSIVRNLTEND